MGVQYDVKMTPETQVSPALANLHGQVRYYLACFSQVTFSLYYISFTLVEVFKLSRASSTLDSVCISTLCLLPISLLKHITLNDLHEVLFDFSIFSVTKSQLYYLRIQHYADISSGGEHVINKY